MGHSILYGCNIEQAFCHFSSFSSSKVANHFGSRNHRHESPGCVPIGEDKQETFELSPPINQITTVFGWKNTIFYQASVKTVFLTCHYCTSFKRWCYSVLRRRFEPKKNVGFKAHHPRVKIRERESSW